VEWQAADAGANDARYHELSCKDDAVASRILISEDDSTIGDVLASSLRLHGFTRSCGSPQASQTVYEPSPAPWTSFCWIWGYRISTVSRSAGNFGGFSPVASS
jgi:hypothetical protein